jgi:hypothetical protein
LSTQPIRHCGRPVARHSSSLDFGAYANLLTEDLQAIHQRVSLLAA